MSCDRIVLKEPVEGRGCSSRFFCKKLGWDIRMDDSNEKVGTGACSLQCISGSVYVRSQVLRLGNPGES